MALHLIEEPWPMAALFIRSPQQPQQLQSGWLCVYIRHTSNGGTLDVFSLHFVALNQIIRSAQLHEYRVACYKVVWKGMFNALSLVCVFQSSDWCFLLNQFHLDFHSRWNIWGHMLKIKALHTWSGVTKGIYAN